MQRNLFRIHCIEASPVLVVQILPCQNAHLGKQNWGRDPRFPPEEVDQLSRTVEEVTGRMLRARDAMDRDYAEPLDIASLARIANVSEAHFIGPSVPPLAKRHTVSPATAGDVLATRDRPKCHRHLPGCGIYQPGHIQPEFPPRSWRGTGGVPAAEPHSGGSKLLRDGLGATEQFWRSQARKIV